MECCILHVIAIWTWLGWLGVQPYVLRWHLVNARWVVLKSLLSDSVEQPEDVSLKSIESTRG